MVFNMKKTHFLSWHPECLSHLGYGKAVEIVLTMLCLLFFFPSFQCFLYLSLTCLPSYGISRLFLCVDSPSWYSIITFNYVETWPWCTPSFLGFRFRAKMLGFALLFTQSAYYKRDNSFDFIAGSPESNAPLKMFEDLSDLTILTRKFYVEVEANRTC